jgi:hypothetical protein
MTRYQLMSFLHELLLFFISSFLFFPSHIKRIIFCFVYSVDHQPSFIYPSLEEEDILSACVVDVDIISSAQPIHKDSFILKPLLNSITLASLRRLKLIHNLLKYHHILLLLLSLAISVISLIFNPLVFKLESETSCLNL